MADGAAVTPAKRGEIDERKTSGRGSRGAWLGLVPAVIAGVLAVVYALGAVAVYGQVKGAGLDAVQTMPLVPVEQILSRGIGSIASIFTQAFLTALAAMTIVLAYWSERDERALAHPSEWSKLLYLGLPAVPVILAIFMPWEGAAVLAVGVFTMLGLWALGGAAGVGGLGGLLIIAGGSIASILPMSVAASLVEPPPLPAMEVVLSNGHGLQGGLVAETGSHWYLARPDHSIQAIPTATVTRTVITYPKRDRDSSLVELVF